MPKILVQNEALEIECAEGANLLDTLKRGGCNPRGMFSRFLPALFPVSDDVLIIDGRRNLSEPSEREKKVLGDKLAWNVRLASETTVKGDIELHTAARIKL